jgi:NDP-sugar pyrophosphorylase family protein
LNGTGGAIHLAKSILKDKFLVMMGDDLYCKKDLNKLLQHDLAILGFEAEDASRFGVMSVDKQENLREVVEASPKKSKPNSKPKKGLINTGVYVLNKKFFDYDLVSVSKKEFGLPQTLASMAKDHKIRVEKASLWHPIGCPDDLKAAEKRLHQFK